MAAPLNETSQSAGLLLEKFYIGLRNQEVHDYIDALYWLGQMPGNSTNEEIINDCIRKAAQNLRSLYVEHVNTYIAAAKKKLTLKASGDQYSSSSPKHLVIITELLGNFSNIIAELSSIENSYPTVLRLVIGPFNERIVEFVCSCIVGYIEERKLIQLQRKSVNEISGVIQVDTQIGIIMRFKTLLLEYSNFLETSLGPLVTSPQAFDKFNEYSSFSKSSGLVNNQIRELDVLYIGLENLYLSRALLEAVLVPVDENEMLPSFNELSFAQFRCNLLLIQAQNEVFVLESVEDLFYVIRKCVDRAFTSNSSNAMLTVFTKIVEIVDPEQNSSIFAVLYTKTLFRGCYKKFQSILSGSGEVSSGIANRGSSEGNTASVTEGSTSSVLSVIEEVSPPIKDILSNVIAGGIDEDNPELVILNATMAVTSSLLSNASNFGLQSWWGTGFSSTMDAPASVEVSVQNEGPSSSTGLSNIKASPPVSGTRSLLPLIPSVEATPEVEDERKVITRLTSLHDTCIYLSTLGICCLSLKLIESPVEAYFKDLSSLKGHESSTVASTTALDTLDQRTRACEIILKELRRCKVYYDALFQEESLLYVTPYLNKTVLPLLHSMIKGYNISGAVFDARQCDVNDCLLFKELTVSLSTGYIATELAPGLSNVAYKQIILQLSARIADSIIGDLFSNPLVFSEWGALLFQQQMYSIIYLLEDATIDIADISPEDTRRAQFSEIVSQPGRVVVDNVTSLFRRVIWAMKLLTLDSVSDARRYNWPFVATSLQEGDSRVTDNNSTEEGASDWETIDDQYVASSRLGAGNVLFTENMIRCILSRRAEFSRNAIAKIKLNGIPA